jgi:hypothetical protein
MHGFAMDSYSLSFCYAWPTLHYIMLVDEL